MQRADWLSWAQMPSLPRGDDKPDLPEMAPMLRRRLERLGRMGLQVAYRVQPANDPCPTVFASRHGNVQHSLDLLQALAREGAVSPTQFSMSVHNAIGALYSIARGDTHSYTAVAGGRSTIEAAFVEAAGLLAEGAPQAMVVVYDEPLPALYERFRDEPESPYAWACRLAPGALSLSWSNQTAVPAPGLLPHGLEVLQFLLGTAPALDFAAADGSWHWRRHG